jgi:hypothetical protein
MRRFAATLAVLTITANAGLAPAALAEPCARSDEKQAFDVASLKSELMVTAIACQMQDKYNAFVTRYRPELQADERALNHYFSRTGGRHAQQSHDDYITNLANAQSEEGVHQGTQFCQQHMPLFDEVMALKNPRDLSAYAVSKSLAQPIAVAQCEAPKRKLRKSAEK